MISPASTTPQALPVSLTTNPNTRPVSTRTAVENEIDQINNTPNAKKVYDAKVYGGALTAAVPLALALFGIVKAKNNFKNSPKLRTLVQAGIAAVGLYIAIPAAKIGAAISKTLVIFASTRGKSKTE